jgi:hypothetical protein
MPIIKVSLYLNPSNNLSTKNVDFFKFWMMRLGLIIQSLEFEG